MEKVHYSSSQVHVLRIVKLFFVVIFRLVLRMVKLFFVVIFRLTKERDMYEKEALQIEAKNEKLKNEGADEYVLRKQVKLKESSRCVWMMLHFFMTNLDHSVYTDALSL